MANPIKIVKAVASAAKAEADKIAKNSVKTVPGRTAPKTGLENRGNKVTAEAAKIRAQDYKFDMQEKAHEAQIERMATGMTGPKMGAPSAGGKANIKKFNSISKQGDAKLPVKVNSNPTKTSGLGGTEGKLGGQHMGGHAGH
jgi:hypothetical protein